MAESPLIDFHDGHEGDNTPLDDAVQVTHGDEIGAGISDIWQGLEALDIDVTERSHLQKTLGFKNIEPWYKPEFLKPQVTYNYTENSNCRQINGALQKPVRSQQYCNPSEEGPGNVEHQRHTSDVSSMPQLSERTIDIHPPLDVRVTTNTLSKCCQSAGDKNFSIGSPEGQIQEQALKSFETNSIMFWESQGDQTARQQNRETKTKFGGHQNMDQSHTEASGSQQDIASYGLSDLVQPQLSGNWKGYALDTEGEIHNNRACRGSFQTYGAGAGAGAGARRGVGARGGMTARATKETAQSNARITCSDHYNPVQSARGKPQGSPKASYHDGTPFGGRDRVKARRRGQSGQTYVGESNVSFRRGIH